MAAKKSKSTHGKSTSGPKRAGAAKKTAATKNRAAASSGRAADTRFKRGNKYAWKKGQSGNPDGVSKARLLSEAYRAALKESPYDDPRTYAAIVAAAIVKAAASGDVAAARELADRTEGRPRQAVDISTDDRMRQVIEKALPMLTATGLSEEEAKSYLGEFVPEVLTWIN